MPKIAPTLSRKSVEKLAKKQGTHTISPGLYVRVTDDGRASFLTRWMVSGVQGTLGLGTFNADAIPAARQAAREAIAAAKGGNDPRQAKRTAIEAEGKTFAQVAELWLDDPINAKWSPSTRKEAKLSVATLSAAWVARPVASIRRPEVLELIKLIWSGKDGKGRQVAPPRHVTAHRVASAAKRIFGLALDNEWIEVNPATDCGTRLPKHETEHLASLPFKFCPAVYASARPAYKLLMLTGWRTHMVRQLLWAAVDLDVGVARFGKGALKNRQQEWTQPLNDEAVALLTALGSNRDPAALVFTGRNGKMMNSKWAQHERERLAKLHRKFPAFTSHGFRAGMTEWAKKNGVNKETRDEALSHVRGNTVDQAYDRSESDRVEMFAGWGAYLAGK